MLWYESVAIKTFYGSLWVVCLYANLHLFAFGWLRLSIQKCYHWNHGASVCNRCALSVKNQKQKHLLKYTETSLT